MKESLSFLHEQKWLKMSLLTRLVRIIFRITVTSTQHTTISSHLYTILIFTKARWDRCLPRLRVSWASIHRSSWLFRKSLTNKRIRFPPWVSTAPISTALETQASRAGFRNCSPSRLYQVTHFNLAKIFNSTMVFPHHQKTFSNIKQSQSSTRSLETSLTVHFLNSGTSPDPRTIWTRCWTKLRTWEKRKRKCAGCRSSHPKSPRS